ncbi:mas-related G-protein coupled receptor member H-like [Melozone crissalis]|uniref:mas-related G-protein coupled receptor member H-like n=1 Tax=Melozone crissalis TaxID=40204 RepID=UPI0023DBF356|nr:mas-related G-protein coupled receptor member H-like [Melozone crissalis]
MKFKDTLLPQAKKSIDKSELWNPGIFGFTVIDFLYLLFAVLSTLLLLVEDVSCSPILPLLYLNLVFAASAMSYYIGLLWLIVNSTMPYMCKICWLCCRREFPECPRPVLISVQRLAFTLLFAVMLMVTFPCRENCQANFISMYIIFLLLFVAPVVISCTIDFIKAKWGSQQQQPKRRNIVIFLMALFILFLSLWNFLQQLGYITVPSQVVFLLACIHSSIKPFIYFLVGRCCMPCSMGSLRLSLQRVFEEPRENTAHSNDPTMDMGI